MIADHDVEAIYQRTSTEMPSARIERLEGLRAGLIGILESELKKPSDSFGRADLFRLVQALAQTESAIVALKNAVYT